MKRLYIRYFSGSKENATNSAKCSIAMCCKYEYDDAYITVPSHLPYNVQYYRAVCHQPTHKINCGLDLSERIFSTCAVQWKKEEENLEKVFSINNGATLLAGKKSSKMTHISPKRKKKLCCFPLMRYRSVFPYIRVFPYILTYVCTLQLSTVYYCSCSFHILR